MAAHENPANTRARPFATALPVGALTLGGWLGQRYDLTWRGNLLALNWDEDFLRPFQEKKSEAGFYVGLGKTFEGLTRFAAGTRDEKLLALRRHVLDALLASQDPDGYLGTYLPEVRISRLWDVHELAYILFALVSDWRLFGEAASLDAAKRLGNDRRGDCRADVPPDRAPHGCRAAQPHGLPDQFFGSSRCPTVGSMISLTEPPPCTTFST